ncbi:hypothetical protein WL29_34050 [Burkholderia ubonensis]|uniref:Uncharacterized protein n=1 Tax=Burkholderia ubonensis TaxID=101571 RepID=A0A106Q058_9BURK|nr:hypothetical protein [Burkholderia ubonensis]KWA77681.1 hypothetical protein WL29_34050 [Burkholderia ubonensis]
MAFLLAERATSAAVSRRIARDADSHSARDGTGKDYGATRLEAACSRAIDLKASNYRFIASTLKNGLESKAETAAAQAELPLVHANVRGPSYYH